MPGLGRHSWIGTFTGLRFFPLDPQENQICIEDIAHHLSWINRYTGAPAHGYNVAHHCVLVSELCLAEDARWGLMHDASEAFITDVNKPLKNTVELAGYRAIEHDIMGVVCHKFDLDVVEPSSVVYADALMAKIECSSIFPPGHPMWMAMPERGQRIEPWTADQAERAFLIRFHELFDG